MSDTNGLNGNTQKMILIAIVAIAAVGVSGASFASESRIEEGGGVLTTEPGALNLIVQGGSFALLAWIFVYWLPRIVTGVNAELAANREGIDKIVDRTLLERKEDRDARHKLADQFNSSLLSIYTENSKQTDRITEAIRQQTDKLTNKLDVVVLGLLKGAGEAATKLKKETDER